MPDVGWILFLVAAWMLGHSIFTRLVGSGLRWLPFSDQGEITATMLSTEGLRFVFRQIASFWFGVMLLSTSHYIVSYILIKMFGYEIFGMETMAATSFVLIPCSLLAGAVLHRSKRLTVSDDYRPIRHNYALFKRPVINSAVIIYLVLTIAYAVWLFYSSFSALDGAYRAGATVHSDLGPHTAMVSSFSVGQNIPTGYQHFANDGINYHFFFYYFCGLLNQLGLGFVASLNVPSIFAMMSMLALISLLAYRITGHAFTAILAPILTIFRSSWAGLTDLIQKADELGLFSREFFHAIWQQRHFIGNTPRDDWGLWSINVYANQRHLALGISILLITILLALPDLERGVNALPRPQNRKFPVWWQLTKNQAIWRTSSPHDRKRQLILAFFLVLLPFWHGSMTLAALLVLFPLALFSANRLAYACIALATILSAILTSLFFAPHGSSVISFLSLDFGFIAEPSTLLGSLRYILEMMGPLLPLIILAFILARWRTKLYLLAASIPLVFAFLVRLTPDLTVNHKFILITIILWNAVAAESVVRLFNSKKWSQLSKTLTVLLLITLVGSGVYEHKIYHNINSQVTVDLNTQSQVNEWVSKNTKPRDVFLTAPYSYHSFFLTGRPVWYGHAYYAWSAGHDTATREAELEELFTKNDPYALQAYADKNDIAYLLVDNHLRDQYPLFNETLAGSGAEQVARFDDWQQTTIYRLKGGPP